MAESHCGTHTNTSQRFLARVNTGGERGELDKAVLNDSKALSCFIAARKVVKMLNLRENEHL